MIVHFGELNDWLYMLRSVLPKISKIGVRQREGGAVNEVFGYFDSEPIVAANLGQVHRAKLKGQAIVVKVQRPGLKDTDASEIDTVSN